MPVRVGINGFGRIGRNVFRAGQAKDADIEWVAVNDLTDAETLAHLLKYDSILGPFPGDGRGRATAGCIVDGNELKVLAERDPAALPWGDLGVDVVIESTGFFTERDDAAKHLDGGREEGHHLRARRQSRTSTVVLGVNFDDVYDTDDAPRHLQRVVHDELPRAGRQGRSTTTVGIKHGLMTTIHAYTADQRLQDAPHKDLRRARAAAINLVPDLDRRGQGDRPRDPRAQRQAARLRGPRARPDRLGRRPHRSRPTRETTRRGDQRGVQGRRPTPARSTGILRYTEDPIVSSDIVKRPALVDLRLRS